MKALGLLSGGLDSTLAARLLQEQGLDIVGINFASPFDLSGKSELGAVNVSKQLRIPLKVVQVGEDYLQMVRRPTHGYGRNMNPCIDCRIFILKKSKEYAEEIGARFVFTGEVLNERPMSQHLKALQVVEREAGLERKVLRPLSAKLLPKTEAEDKGWVNREGLLDIDGRSRKKQMALAEKLGVKDYPCPAGGCLLTYKEFAAKLRDLFKHKRKVVVKDVALLRIGRHFRLGKNKIIVGRNQAENQLLRELRGRGDYQFEVPDCGSPVTLLQGPKAKGAVRMAAALTIRYSDSKKKIVTVNFGGKEMDRTIAVSGLKEPEVEELRIR